MAVLIRYSVNYYVYAMMDTVNWQVPPIGPLYLGCLTCYKLATLHRPT